MEITETMTKGSTKGSRKKVLVVGLLLCVLASGVYAATTQGLYGAAAAKADKDLTIQEMLVYAIQDEYLARAEYKAILAKFGNVRPFSNIVGAEETHVSYLRSAFSKYNLSVRQTTQLVELWSLQHWRKPNKAGVQAEIENIAMYTRFLAEPEVQNGRVCRHQGALPDTEGCVREPSQRFPESTKKITPVFCTRMCKSRCRPRGRRILDL